MNYECTYIIAYVVYLRSGDEVEGLESTVGKLEVMKVLEGILEVGGDLGSETVLLGVLVGLCPFWCANF